MARHYLFEEPEYFRIIERLFCIIFSAELALRMRASGFSSFFCGPGLRWNLFDTVIVSMMLIDELFQDICPLLHMFQGSSKSTVSILRIMRIFRIVRIFRLARVLHQFGELRMLVVCISDALRSLFWIVLLLMFLVYILACILTQIVTISKVNLEGEAFGSLQKYYGDLALSMFSIYETITEGQHWDVIMEPLVIYCSPWLKIIFFLYSAFVFFALLNVVTGAFVESAIRTGTEDRKKLLMFQMKQLFEVADTDGSGSISWDEFSAQLDNPQMLEYLKGIDLDPDEAADLFNLLDIDESGEIDSDDLVSACLRLHGPAKSIDLATFMREYERQCGFWSQHAALVEQSLRLVLEMLSNLQSLTLQNYDSDLSTKTAALDDELQGIALQRRDVGFTY